MRPNATFDELADPETRFRYCLEDLRVFGTDTSYLAKRAFASAGRFLGMQPKYLRGCARRATQLGGVDAYMAHRRAAGYDLSAVRPIDPNEFGHVYVARLRRFPAVIKIGFSRQVHIRMRQLSYEANMPVDLESETPGCLFDETRMFLARHREHIADEWFWDKAFGNGYLPKFLRGNYSSAQWINALAKNQRRGEGAPGAGHGAAALLILSHELGEAA